ncbi:MAG: GDSL-type esterase/lipase family protein [Coprobacillus sp.]
MKLEGNVYYKLKRIRKEKYNVKQYKLIYLINILKVIILMILVNSIIEASVEKGIAKSENGLVRTVSESANIINEITIDGKEQNKTNEYDYSQPVPKNLIVENSYFDDAVFIGDSRMEGLVLNTGLSNVTSYTYNGLTVDDFSTKSVVNKNGTKISIVEALKEVHFKKVYIMFGTCEIGWTYHNVFIEKYSKIIDEIKSVNPKTIIYLQEIIPVSKEVSTSHNYIKNKKISEYNILIRKMAKQKQVFYIDLSNAVAMSDGSLPEEVSIDGIHLKKAYCEKWLTYLKSHTLIKYKEEI